ncbi:MAG: fibronectin type III domain-containing protein [Adhaeribacter sp.]
MVRSVLTYFYGLILLLTAALPAAGQQEAPAVQVVSRASPRPDRILLTWQTDARHSQTVTWRTDATVSQAQAQIAVADASPLFAQQARTEQAKTESLKTEQGPVRYHSVHFQNLKPGTLYAYRVGDGRYWSEWFQFRTAPDQAGPFSFIFLGDAQTELFSLWSRTLRAAYAAAPQARFMVHAGDLVNKAESDQEWQEWFAAGSFIFASMPQFLTPGNHEYTRTAGLPHLSKFWDPQVNLPANGPLGRKDVVYYFDYQNVRLISLNSYWLVAEQALWLERVLRDNPQQWTVVMFHYPMFSSSGRNTANLQRHWQPLLEKYKVDLVLQGHEHTYARGSTPMNQNLSASQGAGPVYVTSVSGPKMYQVSGQAWMERAAENTQLYQVIEVDAGKLVFKAYTVTGELYDGFELWKTPSGTSLLHELLPANQQERRFHNTLKP